MRLLEMDETKRRATLTYRIDRTLCPRWEFLETKDTDDEDRHIGIQAPVGD